MLPPSDRFRRFLGRSVRTQQPASANPKIALRMYSVQDMWVYITEEESFGAEDFANTDALVWLQEDVPLGDYAAPERSIHLEYLPSPVRANQPPCHLSRHLHSSE